MTRIGLLSDTHSLLHPKVVKFLKNCDEIWHAGDIGNIEVLELLEKHAKIRAVYGNIDNESIRSIWPENNIFELEDMKVFITHIGGYPDRYQAKARKIIDKEKPDIFISGHSHILKVIPDPKRKLLHINPGAAGNSGYHKTITCIRFVLDSGKIDNLEVFDLGGRSNN